MRVHSKVELSLLSVVLAAGLVACGGSSSLTGVGDAAAPAPGATITGTVVLGGASASSGGGFRALSGSSGIRVSVVGTALAATTDDSGVFTLSAVPTGEKLELRFEAPGIDARLEVEGLSAGQTLRITVEVSGSRASRVDDDGEIELRGTVTSVGAGSLTLLAGGETVTVFVVDGVTRILDHDNMPIPLADVANRFVQVEGDRQLDGSVRASKIKIEDDDEADDEDEQEIEFEGTIRSLTPLTIGSHQVVTDSRTRILDDDGNPTSLAPEHLGRIAEVEGWMQGGQVLAKKIKLED